MDTTKMFGKNSGTFQRENGVKFVCQRIEDIFDEMILSEYLLYQSCQPTCVMFNLQNCSWAQTSAPYFRKPEHRERIQEELR